MPSLSPIFSGSNKTAGDGGKYPNFFPPVRGGEIHNSLLHPEQISPSSLASEGTRSFRPFAPLFTADTNSHRSSHNTNNNIGSGVLDHYHHPTHHQRYQHRQDGGYSQLSSPPSSSLLSDPLSTSLLFAPMEGQPQRTRLFGPHYEKVPSRRFFSVRGAGRNEQDYDDGFLGAGGEGGGGLTGLSGVSGDAGGGGMGGDSCSFLNPLLYPSRRLGLGRGGVGGEGFVGVIGGGCGLPPISGLPPTLSGHRHRHLRGPVRPVQLTGIESTHPELPLDRGGVGEMHDTRLPAMQRRFRGDGNTEEQEQRELAHRGVPGGQRESDGAPPRRNVDRNGQQEECYSENLLPSPSMQQEEEKERARGEKVSPISSPFDSSPLGTRRNKACDHRSPAVCLDPGNHPPHTYGSLPLPSVSYFCGVDIDGGNRDENIQIEVHYGDENRCPPLPLSHRGCRSSSPGSGGSRDISCVDSKEGKSTEIDGDDEDRRKYPEYRQEENHKPPCRPCRSVDSYNGKLDAKRTSTNSSANSVKNGGGPGYPGAKRRSTNIGVDRQRGSSSSSSSSVASSGGGDANGGRERRLNNPARKRILPRGTHSPDIDGSSSLLPPAVQLSSSLFPSQQRSDPIKGECTPAEKKSGNNMVFFPPPSPPPPPVPLPQVNQDHCHDHCRRTARHYDGGGSSPTPPPRSPSPCEDVPTETPTKNLLDSRDNHNRVDVTRRERGRPDVEAKSLKKNNTNSVHRKSSSTISYENNNKKENKDSNNSTRSRSSSKCGGGETGPRYRYRSLSPPGWEEDPQEEEKKIGVSTPDLDSDPYALESYTYFVGSPTAAPYDSSLTTPKHSLSATNILKGNIGSPLEKTDGKEVISIDIVDHRER